MNAHPLPAVRAFVEARTAVQDHPMCLRLLDEGAHFVVVYPDGDFPVDGLRVPRSAEGLRMALERMERHWMDSYPNPDEGR